MNGSGSRRKGSVYERKIAAVFSEAFGHAFTLRRVPLSGGLDIKCDVYDPTDDGFPFYIECKNRKTTDILSIINGTSDLYDWFLKNEKNLENSYLHKKYVKNKVIPIVVFKEKRTNTNFVMTREYERGRFLKSFVCRGFNFIELNHFVSRCKKDCAL